MGFIGGRLAYLFLKHQYPGGRNVPMARSHPYDGPEDSKLKVLLGPGIFDELRGKVVLDFGCGTGENAAELARNGCARVIGLDIRENVLRDARLRTESIGVADRCCFVTSWFEPVDVILSMDAFEHFEKPDEVLRMMLGLLKEDGYVLVAFGCPWYHPYGGHLFSVFPWAHLIFTESALIRWRSDFKTDGARHFHEVEGGLNQMTIRRWDKLVAESGFRFASYELVPVKAARRFHRSLTREFLTSIVRARLCPYGTPPCGQGPRD